MKAYIVSGRKVDREGYTVEVFKDIMLLDEESDPLTYDGFYADGINSFVFDYKVEETRIAIVNTKAAIKELAKNL